MKLNLKLFVEGTLKERELSIWIVDSITGAVIDAKDATLSLSGDLSVEFDTPQAEFYVYVGGNGEALQTSTAIPLTPADEINYDFTTSASKAYGDNQKEIATGVFALFNGDFYGDGGTPDGVIDNSDLPYLTNQMALNDFNDNVSNSICKSLPF